MSEPVCFTIDDFIHEQDKPHWFVDLSDGTRVFADDNRPGLIQPSSWKRLRDYLYEKNLSIAKFYIRFRSEAKLIGSSEYGYFFRKGIMADVASGANSQRFVVGFLDENNLIHCETWTVPELLKFDGETETRELEGHEDSVIWNSLISKGTNVVQHSI